MTFLVGLLSSLPTHTPTTMSGVNPMNHASLFSWVVPVFPAAGTLILAALPGPLTNDAREKITDGRPRGLIARGA